jgi:hypothetical protein
MLEGKGEGVQVGKGKAAANNGMKRIAALSCHSRLCRAFPRARFAPPGESLRSLHLCLVPRREARLGTRHFT